jgi:hypothetical protein
MVKTTKITVETESLTIIRRARTSVAWCPDCQAEVEVITLDREVAGESISAVELQHWLAPEKLHIWQPPAGPMQICLTSLLHCFEPEVIRRIEKERT